MIQNYTRCIIYVLSLKNTIENSKFNFFTIISEKRKKRKFTKIVDFNKIYKFCLT